MLKFSFPVGAALLGLLFSPSPGRAQDGRGDTPPDATPAVIESTATQTPAPPVGDPTDQPTGIEKIRRRVEANPIVMKLTQDQGFYPKIGGLSPGSGFAAGGGYRQHIGWIYFDLSAAASMKAYTGVDARVRWVETANKTFEAWTDLKYRNNTQDDFYGLGDSSTNEDRVDFGIQTTDVVARVITRVRPWFTLGANVGYLMPDVRRGRDDSLRSIETVYTEATAPGLTQQPDYLHEDVFAQVDSRDAPGFPRRGGVYRAGFGHWDDRTFNAYNFQRLDLEASQFLGLTLRDVIALRLRLAYANNAPGDVVPFYLLPYVGGGDTNRGFREFRFRDENAGLFSAEFRHRVHKMAYVAAFTDVGKVANDWQDIVPTHVKPAYGVGIRIGNDKRVFARFDVGRADEGIRYFLKFSPAF